MSAFTYSLIKIIWPVRAQPRPGWKLTSVSSFRNCLRGGRYRIRFLAQCVLVKSYYNIKLRRVLLKTIGAPESKLRGSNRDFFIHCISKNVPHIWFPLLYFEYLRKKELILMIFVCLDSWENLTPENYKLDRVAWIVSRTLAIFTFHKVRHHYSG